MDESEIELILDEFEETGEITVWIRELEELSEELPELQKTLDEYYEEGEEEVTDLEKLFYDDIERGKVNYVVYYSLGGLENGGGQD